MQIQYFSDLHLEYLDDIPNIKAYKVLCLLGDMGYPFSNIYTKFLLHLQENNNIEKIFLITGNHEYYSSDYSIHDINEKIKDIILKNKLDKITFLNNSSELYNGYLFVGSTLWSFINNNNYLTNDFSNIYEINIDKYNEMYKKSVEYITSTINNNIDKNIILLTHFLPDVSFIPTAKLEAHVLLIYLMYLLYQQLN